MAPATFYEPDLLGVTQHLGSHVGHVPLEPEAKRLICSGR